MEYSIVILLSLVVAISGGPARLRTRESSDTCSKQCTESSKFSYESGTTYEFKYNVETKTQMLGASDDHSTIGISATADIEVHSKCEFVLQLRDVTIEGYDSQKFTDQDKKKEFSRTLERFPLRFSFQDGIVESVCPDIDDIMWAVNIKKGVLSAFQNSMDNFEIEHKGKERDVSGNCDTHYTLAQRGWLALTIKKSKDLSSCTDRHGFETAIQTTPFRISSGLKSLPILKSTHTCDQEVTTKGRLTSSLCHEAHTFRPFSSEQSGATTETTQRLNFVQERQDLQYARATFGEPSDLTFQHGQGEDSDDTSTRETLDLLRAMCDTTEDDIRPETPRDFSSLVFMMKKMSFNSIRRIYNQAQPKNKLCKKNAERLRKFVFDAIPMIGTSASVKLMKTLISNDDVTGADADMWLASLAFIHHPTDDMIKEVRELLGLESLSTKILLPLSTMVHAYCRVNPECSEVAEVKAVINELERNLGGGCNVDQQNFRKIMMSLRALGNTGHAEEAVPSLYNCITRKNSPMDIKIAAIQAFRRLSCGADRNNMMLIYRNPDEDSELRIAAYLAVMQCPTQYVVDQIRETLATEEVNQVGSFVWTHLTNLMESSDPANKYVKQILNDNILAKEFDLDKRKFSRNYEGSFFIDSLNTGAKVDSNLVWSSKSFIPRSASLNLTIDMFGESMNLFELGGRVEGLEHLLETYFGPSGYFKNSYKSSDSYTPSDPKPAKLSSNKLDAIHQQVKIEREEPRGAMYLRMFGNELTYNMFGANNGIDKDNAGSAMLDYLQKLRRNEPTDFTFTKSLMFLDSTYTVPTIAGLPLNLTVNGTATLALKAGGHMDFKKPATSIVLEGNFEPSGAVEIESQMSIDAFVTKGGLKMLTTLHTSTGARGKIEITNKNVLDMSFDYTKEKSEILNVQTSFFMVYKDFEKEQKLISDEKHEETKCTGDRVRKILGLEFCASVYYPRVGVVDGAPAFPLTGPAGVSVAMYKRDVPNGYKVEAKTIKTPQQTLFRFLSDTPGSEVDRAIGLDIDVRHKDKTLMIDLQSPWKKVNVKGELLDSSSMKGLLGTISVDETRNYKLDARIQVDQTKDRMTYTPIISIEVPDWKNVQLNGVLNYQKMRTFDADLTMQGVTEEPVIFQTSIMNTDTQIGTKLKFNYEKGEGYMFEAFTTKKVETKKKLSKASFSPRIYVRTPAEELVELSGTVDYMEGKAIRADLTLDKLTKKPFTATADLTQVNYKKKGRVKYSAKVNVQGPKVSTKIMYTMDSRNWKTILSKGRVDYNFGDGVKDTFVLGQKIKFMDQKIRKSTKVQMTTNSLRNNDLDSTFNLNFVQKKYTTVLDASLRYGKNLKDKHNKNRLELSLDATHKLSSARKQVNYSVEFKFPAKDVAVMVEGGHIHTDRTVENDIKIRYHPERTVAMGIRLHNRTTALDFPNYAGEAFVQLPRNREVSFSGSFGKEGPNKYLSNVEFELIKGQRSRIDLMLKTASDTMYEGMIEVHRPNEPSLKLEGGYTKEEKGFSTFALYKRGDKIYSVSYAAAMEIGKYYKYHVDINIPSRHMIIHLATAKENNDRNYLIDVKWDADKSIDDRFLLNTTLTYEDMDDFEITGVLQYPSQVIELDLKHSTGDRYITHLEVTWSPDNVLEASVTFRNDQPDSLDQRTELSVLFISPFENFRELGLEFSHIKDKKRYQSKGSITWDKNKKILVTTTAKAPFEIHSMDLVGTIRTPFKDYKNLNAQLKHRLDDGELETFALISWGRHRLSLNADGLMDITDYRRTVNGNFELRTPWDEFRLLKVTSAHTDDGKKFTTKFTLNSSTQPQQRDLDVYIMDIDMDINNNPLEVSNKGLIKLTTPDDDITSTWELELKELTVHALLDIQPRRGNRFKVQFDNALQFRPVRLFSTQFELLIPAEEIKELYVSFSHEDRVGYLKTTGIIKKDNVELFEANADYSRQYGSVEFDALIRSHYTEDVTMKLTSAHSIMPYRGNAVLQWAPYQIISIDTNFFYNQFGVFDSTVKFSSPFEPVRRIVLKSTRERRGLNWHTQSEVEFAPRQTIVLSSTYRFDHVKYTSISLKTPFPQFPGLDTSFNLEGSIDNLKGDTSFAMAPYVGTITTDFKWAYYKGTSLSGYFNLNTPYRSYPYAKAKVNSNVLGMSRVSSVEVEYLPTQIIKVTSDYRFTSIETLEGTLTVSSPFTEDDLVAGFTHVGNSRQFHSNAKITCKCIPRPVFTDMYFSSRNGISSTFEMDSPFRGYESVKWNFTHVGELDNFNTNIEYETNGKKITVNNMFTMKKMIKGQFTLTTPFQNMSRIHTSFSHDGKFPNTMTHAEGAYNDLEVTAGFDTKYDDTDMGADFKFTSPIPRFEIIKAGAHKTGPWSDFTADAELQYYEQWQASLKHKFDGQDIFTSGDLKLPYLDDDVTFNFNRTGAPLDFVMESEYAVGSLYKAEGRTVLSVNLPNIQYESKTTSHYDGEEHTQGLSFYHNQKIDGNVDITTKLTGNYNDERLNLDLGCRYEATKAERAEDGFGKLLIKVYTIVEIPYPELQYNRLTYNYDLKNEGENGMDADMEIEVISPLIETFRDIEKIRYDGRTYRTSRKYSYGNMVYTSEEVYTPGSYSHKIKTPHEGYEDIDVVVNYNLDKDNQLAFQMDTTLTATPLTEPIKADINMQINGINDMETIAHFTSPFNPVTSLRAELRNKQYASDIKRYMKLSWYDEAQKFIEVDSSTNINIVESSGIVTSDLTVETTFEEVKEFLVKFEGSMYASPMRAKGLTLIQHNGKKYLDMDSEFSTAEKFSGIIDMRAPHPAEFSFRGLNEGESMEGDLVLNWNKEDKESHVRLEFGLADTGDENTEKKDFHVRLVNPSRIVGYSTKFMRTSDKYASSGKVTWDEENKKEASYETEYSTKSVRLGKVHDFSLKVMVPARTVEGSASYTDGSSQKVGNLNLLWDADNDRGKEVGLKFTVAPYDTQKVVQVDFNVPSMNKACTLSEYGMFQQLSMKTELTANQGDKLLDGKTEFMYSDDDSKTITAEYTIETASDNTISGRWSLSHPDTKTDILMTSSITNTVTKATSDWQLDYKTMRAGKKTIMVKTDVNKENPAFKFEVSTPSEKAALSGQWTRESPYTMVMQASHNAETIWKTDWTIDTVDRSLKAITTYNKDNTRKEISTSALFPNDTSFASDTVRLTDGGYLEEGKMEVSLNYRLLHGHLKWRPEILTDLADFGSNYLNEVTDELSLMVKMVTRELGDELLYKYNALSNSFAEEMKPLSDRFAEELNAIQRDVKAMRKELRRMYKNNDLYLQTIEEMYSGAVKNMMSSYSVAIVKLREAYKTIDDKIEELTNKIDTYPFKERYNNMMATVNNKVDEYSRIALTEMDKLLTKLISALKDLDELYREAVTELTENLKGALTEVFDELTLKPFLEDLDEVYKKILAEYPELLELQEINIDLLNQIQQLLTSALEANSLPDMYKTVYEKTREILTQHFGSVIENEDVQQLYTALEELYDQAAWLYKYTKTDMTLRQLIDKVLDKASEELIKEFGQLPLGLLDLHNSKFTTFDLDNGEIEFDLYLPIPMDNFDELMRFSFEKYTTKLKKMFDKYFPRRDFCLWDMYYKLPPVQWSMEKDWMPPFDAYATVYGKQHFTTFDGRHYDLAGLCSYILAQDIVDKNFTIVQKFSGGPRKLSRDSIVIMLNGQTFEMFQDYMIQVNGQPRDLPYITEKVSIIRLGDRVILESQAGVSVLSDFKSNYHFIGLSGWYYGKVAGLLGSYDNEPSNDLMTPEGEVVDNVKKFMNNWEVDDNCKSKNVYVDNEGRRKNEKCSAVFEKTSSSLRPCFLMIDPEDFQHSCNIDPDSLCDIAALYSQSCARRGITVQVPQSCVKCEDHDSSVYQSGDTLKYTRQSGPQLLQSSMDVVFVVEERQCNRDIANKLREFVYQTEKSLTKTGLSNNRYSLVGYAGDSINSHTMEGQIFNDASKFAMGIESLQFVNLGPNTDPLTAVLRASNMPFRTGVSKSIILVSCSPCTEASGYTYTSLNSVLQQRDITLHILRQTGIQLKNNRSPKTRIYGIDNKNLYTYRQGDDTFSDIDIPSDYCASVAMKTNGSLFDSTNTLHGAVRHQRHFMQTVGDRIGLSASHSQCQECSCELDVTGAAVSVCRRCDLQPFYMKPLPVLLDGAVMAKNQISHGIEKLLF